MQKKLKLVLSIPNLDALGVQHDVLNLFKYWQDQAWDLTLLVHTRTGDFADKFPPSIKTVCVDDFLLFNLPKIRVLERFFIGYRNSLKSISPDVVISFVPICNYGCFFAKALTKRKFALIVSEHAHVTGAMADPQNMENTFLALYRRSFRYLYNSRLVNIVKCIAQESMDDLISNHKISERKVKLVYNPVPIDELRELALEQVSHSWLNSNDVGPIIVNSGRISFQKKQDVLINSFSIIKKKYPQAKLLILGKGNSSELEELSQSLGLSGSVEFLGYQKNPWAIISKCNLFVLSSIWEGLPLVLIETQAINIPIVSTECPSGPREILMNGEAGLLCETQNVVALADAVLWALDNPEKMNDKVNTATGNIKRFDPKKIAEKYSELARIAYDLNKENS